MSKVDPSYFDSRCLIDNPELSSPLKAGSDSDEPSGQYLWHLGLPPSLNLHTDTTSVTLCSRIIRQKLSTVFCLGP